MQRSVSVISALVSNAVHMGLIPKAYATSAVRDAKNRSEFLKRIEDSCGIQIDVLSGEREAEYAFRAAAKPNGGLVDIGGASFQLVTGQFKQSFPLGCIRGRDIAQAAANAANCDENWPYQREIIVQRVRELILSWPDAAEWTGVGGTITTLAAYSLGLDAFDADKVDAVILSRKEVEELIAKLSELGEARRTQPMLSVRHDVILYGAAILAAIMDVVGMESISVNTRDGMEGYADYLMNHRYV